MKTDAIICEYNPFHLGHLYHLEQTEKKTGESAIICLMSGNYVQRGDFAMFDKYARAKAALRDGEGRPGADLVLELPITYALSSAEGFARGAVNVLNALGVIDCLSFGSESGSLDDLRRAAELLLSDDLRDALAPELSKGRSFASAREKAAASIDGRAADVLRHPNNILAVEYLKALITTDSTITPMTIQREGAGYHSIQTDILPSATAIRELIKSGGQWRHLTTDRAGEIFSEQIEQGLAPACLDNAERAVLSRLRTMSDDDYRYLPFGEEGLSNRFMKYAHTCRRVGEVMDMTKTKRYAYARIRRMLICAYLGITNEHMRLEIPYVRVLAFTPRGRELLRAINKSSSIPVITRGNQVKKLSASAHDYFALECKAYDLYALAQPKVSPCGLEWTNGARLLNE